MQAENPLISVIITAYNRASLVSRAIESATKQTYTNIEIIVVDDASIDNTLEVVDGLKNPLIRIIKNAKNLGASGAKNVGVAGAQGEYIAFLDSDDVWSPQKLELQYAALQKSSNIPLCFTAIKVHRSSGKTVTRIARRKNSWFESITYSETFSLGSTLLASKECMNKVGEINQTLVRFEDRDWCLRYFDYYPDFVYIEEPLVDVYNSSSWVDAQTVKDSAEKILELNKNRITSHSKQQFEIFHSSMEFEVAVALWRNNKNIQAIFTALKACFISHNFIRYISYRITKKIKQLDFF
ncbi:MAG: glycosyltransferase family 2 protein [Rickettsiales bacterium]